MSGTNRRGKPQPVMSWTRFRLPLNEPLPNLDDESDEDPRGWKKYLGPLDEAEGRRYTACGRVLEIPRRLS